MRPRAACATVLAMLMGAVSLVLLVLTQTSLGGLQGPTISPVITREPEQAWHSVSIVVSRDRLPQAIGELRGIGGSGIIVTPVTYIFEEEPPRYKAMLQALRQETHV